jgi:hypothetical protein
MWRLASRFFLGLFVAAMFTNAIAVYLFHDVDADRIGKLSLAYWELTLEFFVFSLVLTLSFLLVTWIGTTVFRLRNAPLSSTLGLVLGIAVTLIQYPAEFAVRRFATNSADAFLLGYLLVSRICCVAIVLLNSRKRQPAR